MRKLLTILSLLILPTGLFAQLEAGMGEVGITFAGGISRVYDEYNPSFYRPSASIGIYHKIKINKKMFIGSEFSLLQIEGKQQFKEDIWDTQQLIRNTYYYLSHSTYLGFSFMTGWDIYKFSIDIECQILYLIVNKGEEIDKKTYDGIAIVDDNNKYNDFFDTNCGFGIRFGLTYQITKRISVTGNYFDSLTEVHSYVEQQLIGKITQITVGAKYSLWSNN